MAETPTSPSPSGPASSTASSAATSPFVADPGPRFDPGRGEPPELAVAGAAEELPPELGWEETQVSALLEAQGSLLHQAVAVDKESDEWLYTRTDLKAIGGPLTRILNRYDATRAGAAAGDELALLIGLSGYVTRSYRTRRQTLAQYAQLPDVPVSGHSAPEGTGPGTETPVTPQLVPEAEIPDDERPHEWST